MTNEKNLLEVRDLRTYYYTNYGVVKAVDGVSFSVKRGEKVAIIGESGAGKSQTGMSIIRLIQSPPGSIDSGEVLYEGTDLLKLKKDEMRNFRGIHIGMIFQEAAQALNPVYTVGSQIADAYREHHDCTKEEAWKKQWKPYAKYRLITLNSGQKNTLINSAAVCASGRSLRWRWSTALTF